MMNMIPMILGGFRGMAILAVLAGLTTVATATDPDQGGGIGGTGIIGMGPVQRFGSIFLNGREYFLSERTQVEIENRNAPQAVLHLGDIVVVNGVVNAQSGRTEAERVLVYHAMRGRVESLDAKTGVLRILGQTVHVQPDTYGENNSMANLSAYKVGDAVVVSGLIRPDGSWTATRIEPERSNPSEFLLHGVLRSVDSDHRVLAVGGQTIAGNTSVFTAEIAAGSSVRLSGHYQANGQPLVDAVSAEPPITGAAGVEIEMTGYADGTPLAGRVHCNGIQLNYGKNTLVSGGDTNELPNNALITVRGILRPDGDVDVTRMILHADLLHVDLTSNRPGAADRKPGNQPPSTPGPDKFRPEPTRIDRPMIFRP